MEGNQVVAGDVVVAAAKVAVPEVGAEMPVISKERWEDLRRMQGDGQSVSQMARLTGLDRKTVRSCLRKSEWMAYRRTPAAETLLSAHRAWLVERAPEVNYSAQILFQELRATHGYRGGYDTVRNAVRPLRTEAGAAALTQCRFETEPGEQAQVDWGQVRVRFVSGPTVVHVFVLTLGYSRRAWAEGYENERLSALLAAHEHAFEHFGGHPAELLYDRMRTVTAEPGEGKAHWNATFEAFARHWSFEPRLCRPYRAQTKGKVESGVKYVKRNFVPGRVFRDLADFNDQLLAWQTEIADVRVHGTTHERPIDRFAREASALVRTPEQASFCQALRRERVVADDWLVAIDANRYSVPWRLIGKKVAVVRVGAIWQISHRGQVVAEHPVLAGRHQLQVDPAHGPGAVARNARTRFGASAPTPAPASHALDGVEMRDLAVYEQMLEVA
ncbi:MAG: IS21 family transposase [Pyrinomonadaceae bacterium]|nr:IS21 family transposase [Pyrinomonadaceae bacterium]